MAASYPRRESSFKEPRCILPGGAVAAAWHRGGVARTEVYGLLVRRAFWAARIQAAFRGLRARIFYDKQKRAAKKIQAHWRWKRLWTAYVRFRKQGRAAVRIETIARGFLARRRWQKVVQIRAKFRLVVRVALLVHRFLRVLKQRRHGRKEKELWAVRYLQKRWRRKRLWLIVQRAMQSAKAEAEAHAKEAAMAAAAAEDAVTTASEAPGHPPTTASTAGAGAAAPKPTLSFAASLASSFVRISEDGLTAEHMDPNGPALQGVVFGSTRIPTFSAGAYFEVLVQKANLDEEDGLTLGVTTALPQEIPEPFVTADDVPNSYCFGFDGKAVLPDSDDPIDTGWNPKDVRVGDRVGLLVTPQGEGQVFRNGEAKVSGVLGLPVGVPLFPIVDLLGSAVSVSLAPIPATQKGPCFSSHLKGRMVALSEQNTVASKQSSDAEALHSVVFVEGKMPAVAGGFYFEVRVEQTLTTELDGLVLGVCGLRPSQEDMASFETADDVPNSWTLGYNGEMRFHDEDENVPIGWNPKDLAVGDVVGLFVGEDGEGELYQNGVEKLSHITGIPPSRSLYAFVDLLGNTAAVRLLPGQPPTRAPRPPKPALIAYDLSQVLSAFALSPKSPHATMSAEMLLARCKPGSEGAVVFGNGAAPSFPAGHFFQVRLETLGAGTRGPALGFAAGTPGEAAKGPEVPQSCSIGYEGKAYVAGRPEPLALEWSPSALQSGDTMGLLMAPNGFLSLCVNGRYVARDVAGNLPSAQAFLPFVDFGQRATAISLDLGAKPPDHRFGGFSRALLSPVVTLKGSAARRTGVHPKGAGLGAVLFGDGPLRADAGVRYFEVCIEDVTSAFADGLTIGVAFELPKAFPAEPFATSEEVPKSLCYGFDGMAHRYNWEELLPIDWNPATLEIGDTVGILCTAEGMLQLIINGVLESEALQVPKDLELFPLVELMGNTLAVSVKADATPPAIQRKPPKPPEAKARFS
eukprot:s2626_g3.t1